MQLELAGLRASNLRPVDRALLEVVDAESRDRLRLVQRVFGVLAPLVGRADDDARGELRLAQRGEERVDVRFAERVFGQVELALDGAVFAGGAFLRDKVDADVADLALPRPIVPHPDFGEAVGVIGSTRRNCCISRSKRSPRSRYCAGVVAELGEDRVERNAGGHGSRRSNHGCHERRAASFGEIHRLHAPFAGRQMDRDNDTDPFQLLPRDDCVFRLVGHRRHSAK